MNAPRPSNDSLTLTSRLAAGPRPKLSLLAAAGAVASRLAGQRLSLRPLPCFQRYRATESIVPAETSLYRRGGHGNCLRRHATPRQIRDIDDFNLARLIGEGWVPGGLCQLHPFAREGHAHPSRGDASTDVTCQPWSSCYGRSIHFHHGVLGSGEGESITSSSKSPYQDYCSDGGTSPATNFTGAGVNFRRMHAPATSESVSTAWISSAASAPLSSMKIARS